MLTEGIPVIYYGTEQGFSGRDDPFNREPLWTSGFNQDNEIYRLIAAVNNIRKQVGPTFHNSLHMPIFTSFNLHASSLITI